MRNTKLVQECYDLVNDYFKGSRTKTFIWFKAVNPSLGGLSPLEMIHKGRVEKLHKFIGESLKDNL